MIKIQGKAKCCGCKACEQSCPKQCIVFNDDEEGFGYPCVNLDLCINCGLCEKVCPVLQPFSENKPQSTVAAINPDNNVRESSSSGGIFTLLAENIVKNEGVVFGAVYDADWMVSIMAAHTSEELFKFRGSKYLQADIGDTFKECKVYLEKGIKVLFSGTPCQISGLKHYLRKNYDNLITLDIVCHGVPSPGVWKRYLNEVTEDGKKSINNIRFRDKRNGWRKFSFVLDYTMGGQKYTFASEHNKNVYMRAFLSDLILRPSCYECPVKLGRSHADITVADFWGVEHILPDIDDDSGTSLVLLNTPQGTKFFNACVSEYIPVDLNVASQYNTAIFKSSRPHPKRSEFFIAFSQKCNVSDLVADILKPSFRQRLSILRLSLKSIVKGILSPIDWG